MAYLVKRFKAADGTYQPDYDDFPYGVLTHENTPQKAIKAYARRVMPGPRDEELQEGDLFSVSEVSEDEQLIEVTSRRVQNKFTVRQAEEV